MSFGSSPTGATRPSGSAKRVMWGGLGGPRKPRFHGVLKGIPRTGDVLAGRTGRWFVRESETAVRERRQYERSRPPMQTADSLETRSFRPNLHQRAHGVRGSNGGR
jgi:hypothetical protein